ncbi:MAG: fatty acid desaturase [Pirellulales bacterium]|nr:fatty acid desaturase [Pirellulales bacterium]
MSCTETPTAPGEVSAASAVKRLDQKLIDMPMNADAAPAHRVPLRERLRSGVDWPVVTWIAFLHAGALAAPFFFTWKSVLLAVFLGWLTGGVGICLGYHRMLTHRSFDTFRPIRWIIAGLGNLAGQGSPLMWVANHRKHHAFSDHEGDPHSPQHGGLWSHMLWLMPRFSRKHYDSLYKRYAPDLLRDPFVRLLDHTFLLWYFLFGGALFAIGYFGWDFYTGCSFVVYGMFVRLVYVLHATWFVNSASHIWGYRNYETRDNSRNLWWVGLLTYGEGWHNNHHAFQRMARHGHRWWEVDVTYWAICVMEWFGLAWNVVHDARPKAAA